MSEGIKEQGNEECTLLFGGIEKLLCKGDFDLRPSIYYPGKASIWYHDTIPQDPMLWPAVVGRFDDFTKISMPCCR